MPMCYIDGKDLSWKFCFGEILVQDHFSGKIGLGGMIFLEKNWPGLKILFCDYYFLNYKCSYASVQVPV